LIFLGVDRTGLIYSPISPNEPGGGGGGSGNGGPSPDPCTGNALPMVNEQGYYLDRIKELNTLISANPIKLIADPCNYLSQWINLTNFQVPQTVNDRLSNVNQLYVNSPNPVFIDQCWLQDIQDASSPQVNFDYFPVKITTLPSINGVQFTPQTFFEYFRLHINEFVDISIAQFSPYQDNVINDVPLWNSSNPLGAMLHIQMLNNGTVIVSDFANTQTSNKMIFTTVRTPLDEYHPVSGNRSFGIQADPNGGYFFFTSGVDRISQFSASIANDLLELVHLESAFEQADELWKSMQQKMIAFVIQNGGQASYYQDNFYTKRPKWIYLQKYLRKEIDFAQFKTAIGC
jgi:hypothetical protein